MPTCMSAFGLHHGACSLSDTPAGDPVGSGASVGLRFGAGLRRVATEASSLRRGGGSAPESKQDEGSTTRCSRKQEALTGVLPPGLDSSITKSRDLGDPHLRSHLAV